jgi:trimethylamine--corrinoid protein Co-methyltransferase
MIIQDEALSYLKRLLASFEVSDDTLALDVIREVGIGGNFLAQPHTAKFMRRELWRSGGLFPRLDYQTWADAGAESTLDRATARLDEILLNYPPEPVLPPQKAELLREIRDQAVEQARKSNGV